jgi:hypothetical protein
MTSTFDDYLSYYGCSTLSLALLCDVSIAVCSFLVTTRKVSFLEVRVLEGHDWDGASWDHLLVN